MNCLENPIREWRQTGGVQSGLLNNAQSAHDPAPSLTVSASRKRKPSQSIPLSLGAPSPALHSRPDATSMQLSTSTAKKGAAPATKGKKLKSVCLSIYSLKNTCFRCCSTIGFSYLVFDSFNLLFVFVTGSVIARCIFNEILTIPPLTGSSGRGQAVTEPSEAVPDDNLIGRKVMTRWPKDNNFYEAVITEYNPTEVC